MSPVELFKCLADETRTKMALLIESEGELCVCELTCALDEPQPKISRHLALLRNAGLLADRRQGQWVYYRLHPSLDTWVLEVLAVTRKSNAQWLKEQVKRLQDMDGRPQRAAVCC
ncbi:metalloregulator ArsR/SmtB family transcription factor [Marinimicrobium sp. ABcell2]|uniref:metalloregulator ArsR/SmtB family transcription factor n=1 Tax=Marinimicrobium sp. ABcell2 TaxID=3069751 RepID=UPI00359CAC60